MKRISLLLCLAVLTFAASSNAQLSIRDDLDRSLFLKAPATRVVSLASFLTEIAFAIGAGDKVVGVDELSTYPPEVFSIPKLPAGDRLSLDKLALLKPDLVLAWRGGIRPEDVERITQFGAVVFVASAGRLEDVPRLMRAVGTLTGRDATLAVTAFESQLGRLRAENANKQRLRVFVEIWNRPLTTVTSRHVVSEALTICGGQNVFEDFRGIAPRISWDEVAARDPQVILGVGSASGFEEFRDNWSLHPTFSAVQAQRMIFFDDDALLRATPRAPQGIARLCDELDALRAGERLRVVQRTSAPAQLPVNLDRITAERFLDSIMYDPTRPPPQGAAPAPQSPPDGAAAPGAGDPPRKRRRSQFGL